MAASGDDVTPAAAAPASPITHFSHPHELHPLSLNKITICAACRLPSSAVMYTCLPCAYTLHQSCAELPRLITHASHAGCVLSLQTTSSYPGGIFNCDGCRRRGDGWTYHCGRCEYDLHVTCACRPMRIKVPAHGPSCELQLMFKNPYASSNGFACDVCRKIGTKQWLYHCSACEFDVHLDCASGPPPPQPQPTLQHGHSFPGETVAENLQLVHGTISSGMDVVRYPLSSSAPPLPQLTRSGSAVGVSAYTIIHQFPGGNVGSGFGPERVNDQQRDEASGGAGNNLTVAAMEGEFREVIGGDNGGGGGGGGDVSSY